MGQRKRAKTKMKRERRTKEWKEVREKREIEATPLAPFARRTPAPPHVRRWGL